jgi:phenylacetic acid degradation operon negative regulatory protein
MTPRIGTVHEEGRRQTFTREENPTWDKKWTLVWYSIPDEHRLQRSRLGRWLNFRGFGALQDGTWIAPGTRVTDIRTLINQLGLDEHVIVFTAEAGSNGDISAIVERAWNVPELALMYDRFVEEFAPFRTAAKLKQLDPREALLLRTRIIEMFRQTGSQDLNLPEQVLGIRWRRRDAIKTFRKVESSLLPKAAEYFRRLAKLEN